MSELRLSLTGTSVMLCKVSVGLKWRLNINFWSDFISRFGFAKLVFRGRLGWGGLKIIVSCRPKFCLSLAMAGNWNWVEFEDWLNRYCSYVVEWGVAGVGVSISPYLG